MSAATPAASSPAPLALDTVLSPEWLDAVLAPTYRGVRVRATTVTEELTTIASKVRFAVDYADGTPAGAPDALCVKGYFGPPSPLTSVGQVEARFYADVAPGLHVRVPPCVHSGIDAETGHGLVLMVDLVAAGCTFLTALSPYSVDEVAATLEQLARLHSAPVPDADWLAPRIAGFLDAVDEARLHELLADGRADEFGPTLRDAARVRAALAEIAARSASRAGCLVHGDAHAGNLYVDPGGAPGLIDWQVVQRGSWALDVAYHIGAVLTVDDRAAHEHALLAHYLEVARGLGAPVPDADAAWDEYRDALAYGYYMWAITQRVDRPVIEEFVHRLGTAIEQHDTFTRLGV